MAGLVAVQFVKHAPVSWLGVDVVIKWKAFGLWLPRDKIGEAPGDEGLAVRLGEAKGK